MRFIITGRNIDVTEGLKSAVEEKLGKLDRFFAPETEVNVTLSVEKERQKIEVTIPVKGNIIRLSRATLKNIHENLFWAFIYNIIGIPLAAGAWYMLLGWKLNPMFGAAAMSLSSFCVVTNALRLNLFKMHDASKDQKIKNSVVLEEIQVQNITKQEEKTMKKTMKIEGMMCGHCEAAVKKALESLEGVEEAIVSHEEGTAVVSMTNEVSDDVLTQTVEDKDYKVTEIE